MWKTIRKFLVPFGVISTATPFVISASAQSDTSTENNDGEEANSLSLTDVFSSIEIEAIAKDVDLDTIDTLIENETDEKQKTIYKLQKLIKQVDNYISKITSNNSLLKLKINELKDKLQDYLIKLKFLTWKVNLQTKTKVELDLKIQELQNELNRKDNEINEKDQRNLIFFIVSTTLLILWTIIVSIIVFDYAKTKRKLVKLEKEKNDTQISKTE
ncbi:hypothetical protein VO56_02220 [Mycoplasmopsis gallinacea]|uniref:Uncharacterized protein n=1 Tax=Mycoplasmopsis gallinacea TaxID=29556 RepID=A0A0D5ZK45_9BACT|nr:hypothetical protein VO56_02220 [Mycoplasmopsis gallinacea]